MSETIQDRIRVRLEELALTPEKASREAGLDKTYLRKLFERPGASPRGDTLSKLAAVLEVSTSFLTDGIDGPRGAPLPEGIRRAKKEFRRADVDFIPPGQLNKSIQVLGTAAGSVVQHDIEGFAMNGTVDYVRCPPALEGVPGAYAIYVTGDSMDPMHPQGAL